MILSLSCSGAVKYKSDDVGVVNRWLPIIREHKADIIAALSAHAPRWRVIYRDGGAVEVVYTAPVPRALVAERYPETGSIEPAVANIIPPDAPLTLAEVEQVRAWLASIGETDVDTIGEVLAGCERDTAAQRYFIGRASQADGDDRRTCGQCARLSMGRCRAGKPVLDVLQRCDLFAPGAPTNRQGDGEGS
jgi:hypothetical protein